MTENDIKTGKELLQEAFIMKNPEWMKELQIMVRPGLDYFISHLPNKIFGSLLKLAIFLFQNTGQNKSKG